MQSMQEKESVMDDRFELKIPSLGMPNSYPPDRIFNPNLTTNKDSYILSPLAVIIQAASVLTTT